MSRVFCVARWLKTSARLTLCAALLMIAGSADARPALLELEILVRVARCAEKPVKPDSWVNKQLTAANSVLEPHRIQISAQIEHFNAKSCTLLTRAERNRLAAEVLPRGVTVLVLERIRDVDLTSYDLMGVHWRYSGKLPKYQGRRWIMLTARARPPVLAHELGHYLGLRHDPAGGNLMTPGPSDPIWRGAGPKPEPWAPILTPRQGRKLRAAVSRLLVRDTD